MNSLNGDRELIFNAIRKFENTYGSTEHVNITTAPASLILFGDHTHYNDGILLSAAVNRVWVVVLRKRKDRIINFASANTDKFLSASFDSLEQIDCSEFNLLRRFTKMVHDLDYIKFGFDCVVSSNVPDCLGLGSFAGMQVAFLNNIKKVFSINVEDFSLIDLIKKNESAILGKISNQAHHYTAAEAKDAKIYNFDLRTKLSQHINFFDKQLNIIICDTEEWLVAPQERCNERVEECEIGVKGLRLYIWGIKNLRDVELDFLLRHVHMLPKRIFNRILYNVNERKRAESAIKFLRKGLLEDFGILLTESHWGLSKDYEISSENSDFIVEEAVKLPGVVGSKMVSCSPIKSVFNIVDENFTANFIYQLGNLYKRKYNSELKFHILKITHGVKKIATKDMTALSN
ncbi:MAG: galactokinase [Ignavibacteria bacterium]|nr:MAG: galactokinase [Ignavibacteria bacterium]KAF0160715.1 MAG: galactokinase [Ignavibacteria bacterium]